jgi:phage terminase large subunit-like protein
MLAYIEHTAEHVHLNSEGKVVSRRPDNHDRDKWYLANPQLGNRITEEDLANQLKTMAANEDEFAREHLCVWDPEPTTIEEPVIDEDTWQACVDAGSQADPLLFAVDVNPDRTFATVVTAGVRDDGRAHVEVVEHREGTGWVLGRLTELWERWQVPVLLLTGSPAMTFVAKLEAAGVGVEIVDQAAYAEGCGEFFDAACMRGLAHLDQGPLNLAVGNARKRDRGDSWVWGRRQSAGNITPLVASTLALGRALRPAVPAAQPHVYHLEDFADEDVFVR